MPKIFEYFGFIFDLYGWNWALGNQLEIYPTCMVEITQYALKGQKLLAQGNALGIMKYKPTP